MPVERPGYTNVYWMYSVVIGEDYALSRDDLILALRDRGIDSRPFFHSLDTLPPYAAAAPLPQALTTEPDRTESAQLTAVDRRPSRLHLRHVGELGRLRLI